MAVEQLRGARRLVVLTGAGMSQESGIATFRDAQTGWWARYTPEELATPEAFRSHPARVFGWYRYRAVQALAAEPHAGHRALAALERRCGDGFLLVTQNVDGLHQRAGNREVVELHGSLHAYRCAACALPYRGHLPVEQAVEAGEVAPPTCGVCGGYVRPGVVWFGEPLPQEAVERAWAAVAACDLLLVVGTSAVVYPAAYLPALARAAGAAVIEINPEPTPYSTHVTLAWRERAGRALPAMIEALAALGRS